MLTRALANRQALDGVWNDACHVMSNRVSVLLKCFLVKVYLYMFRILKFKNNYDLIRIMKKLPKILHTVHTARQIPTGTSNSRCLCQCVRFGG